jgi:hypothetical protein
VLVGQDEGGAVRAGLGEHVVHAVRQGEEVVALVDVDRAVTTVALGDGG